MDWKPVIFSFLQAFSAVLSAQTIGQRWVESTGADRLHPKSSNRLDAAWWQWLFVADLMTCSWWDSILAHVPPLRAILEQSYIIPTHPNRHTRRDAAHRTKAAGMAQPPSLTLFYRSVSHGNDDLWPPLPPLLRWLLLLYSFLHEQGAKNGGN